MFYTGRHGNVQTNGVNNPGTTCKIIKHFIERSVMFSLTGSEAEDVEILSQVGLNGVPCDAPVADLIAAKHTCQRPAGHGAVREFAEYILTLKKKSSSHENQDRIDRAHF